MICSFLPEPIFFLFSEGQPILLYYSHLPAIITSLLLGFFVLYRGHKSLVSKVFFYIAVSFSVWALLNLILWTNNNTDVIFFTWSFFGLLFSIMSILSVYFIYVFLEKKDVPSSYKYAFFLLMLPVILISPTLYNLDGFDYNLCGASGHENVYFFTYYLGLGGIAALWILFLLFKHYFKLPKDQRAQIVLTGAGIEFFLASFFFSSFLAGYLNDTGVVTDYSLEFYGLFGMIVFLAFIAYVIVKFKLFNIKLIGTQALIYSQAILIGSQFFFIKTTINFVLVFITLSITSIMGFLLVKGVKREIETRERIEKLAAELQIANTRLEELNKQKSEFVSFASHQLRSPLTSIKGNASLILEGDAGPVSPMVKQIVETMLEATKTQINVVEDYLNVSRIELGTMKYNLADIDFRALAQQVMNEQKPNIEAKGLSHSLVIDDTKTYKIKADPDKFKQVLMNIVDNSLKYTPKGSVTVSLTKDDAKGLITFKVADTGVGIRADVMPKLFQKFSRASNANESNIHGTGLGLFIARDIMKAHGGRVWAESEGEGKGSQFYVELPEAK